MSADWDDDDFMSAALCWEDAKWTVVIFVYVYETPGNFTVSLTAGNLISSLAMDNQTIAVYERIHHLDISGDTSVLVPPGTGVWVVAAGPCQRPLENVVCVWNMGANYANIISNVAILNSTVTHEMTFDYAQQGDFGTHTIQVDCSNPVSSQMMTMDVSVVWGNVTLGELACNSTTLWNHSITCQLPIVSFGTGGCFEWDMGDGESVVYDMSTVSLVNDMGDGEPLVYYRDEYCAGYVPAAASATYVQVRLGDCLSLQQSTVCCSLMTALFTHTL